MKVSLLAPMMCRLEGVTALLSVFYSTPVGGFSFPRPFRSRSFKAANGIIRRRPHRTVGHTPFLAAFRKEFFEMLVSSLAFAKLTASGRSIVAVCMLLISPLLWL